MGLSEKSGWGLKFSTLEPPEITQHFSQMVGGRGAQDYAILLVIISGQIEESRINTAKKWSISKSFQSVQYLRVLSTTCTKPLGNSRKALGNACNCSMCVGKKG